MIRNAFRYAQTGTGRLAWNGLALLIFGCAHVPTQTGAMQRAGMEITADALHVQVVELGRRFSGTIETAADEILARAEDPQIRYDALLWKAYAIPLVQEAALRTDPVLAEGDLWAFSIQQSDFFASGAGRDAFGPYHDVALAAADRMEHEALDFMSASAAGDSVRSRTVERMHAWAASHPFQSLRFTRESAAAAFEELLGLSGGGLGATVGDMNRTVAGMYDRLGYMNESLMKQVRWNTELVVADATESPAISPTLAATNSALARLGTLAEITPRMLDSLRAAAITTLREERIAALEAVSAERIAVMQGVAEERATVIAAVRDERLAILATADAIAARSIERTERAATRLMWLGAAIVAVLSIGAWILVLSARRLWRVAGGAAAP
jgi:hypothetical protein